MHATVTRICVICCCRSNSRSWATVSFFLPEVLVEEAVFLRGAEEEERDVDVFLRADEDAAFDVLLFEAVFRDVLFPEDFP